MDAKLALTMHGHQYTLWVSGVDGPTPLITHTACTGRWPKTPAMLLDSWTLYALGEELRKRLDQTQVVKE